MTTIKDVITITRILSNQKNQTINEDYSKEVELQINKGNSGGPEERNKSRGKKCCIWQKVQNINSKPMLTPQGRELES